MASGEKATSAELSHAAHQAYEARDFTKARDFYERVAAMDPKDKDVWNNLGRAHHALRAYDKAIAAYRKAIDLNPNEEYAYNNLGLSFWAKKDYTQAEAMFRKQLEVNPYDTYAHGNLGKMFMETKAFAAAAIELEQATRIKSDDAQLRIQLGEALLETHDEAKALEAFEAAVKQAPNPMVKNNAAYALAKRKVGLDRAKTWVDSAIEDVQTALKGMTLKPGNITAGAMTDSLAAYWDTLGWIYFQQGDRTHAETYLRAAWSLSQSSEVGVHLGHLYLAQGQKPQAIRAFALAGATARPVKEAQEQLTSLLGGSKAANERILRSGEELSKERTLTLSHVPKASAVAEFIFVLNPGGKVEEVQFLSGDENLKGMVEPLRTLHHGVPLPEGDGIRVFRRGVLVADPSSRSTTLIFVTSDMFLSLPTSKAKG